MLKKKLIIFAFMSIIAFGFIVAIPIGVISINLSSYGKIYKSLSYEYLPDEPSAVESLNLNVDFGNIIINYIDPPVNYFVKIDLNIEMAGAGLAGKDYLDYFSIDEGDTSSTPINFTMRLLPGVTESEVESLIKDVSVIVTIQKGIVFDISAKVSNGDFKIAVPFKVQINNIEVNNTIGKISYDLQNCIVGGNITGTTKQGDVILKSEDILYIRNSVWYLKSIQDNVLIDIDQSIDMGGNVTGYMESQEKYVTIIYDDYSYNVGAWFKLVNHTSGIPDDVNHYYNPDGWDWNTSLDSGYEIMSKDFPAKNNFYVSLYADASYLFYRWILYNEP